MSDSSGVNSSDENDEDDDKEVVELASSELRLARIVPRLEMVVDVEPRMACRREMATLAERGRWRPPTVSIKVIVSAE